MEFVSFCHIHLLFRRHRGRDGPGGVDGGLRCVDRAHDVGSRCGIQAKGTGDPGHLPRGEHEPQSQQGVVLEHHKARHQNGGLQKGGQAQADDLLHPLYKAIHISSGNAEHIQRSNGDLDEQDATPLQVCEKDLDHRVGHKDDAEQEHDGAGNDAKAKIQRLCV